MAVKNNVSPIKGFNGLTRRWFIQTTIIVIAFLMVICVIGAYIVHSYYYDSVDRKMLNYCNNAVDTYFENFSSDDATFEKGARSFIYDFKDKSAVEVWIIDKYGKVIISSSGFPVNSNSAVPELSNATPESASSVRWSGRFDSGEKVSTLTKPIFSPKGEKIGAIRYIVSLAEVDAQINTWYVIIVLVFLLIVLVLLISGVVFINSIVKSIREVNDTARMIADGNYDARIDHYLYKDEVGELCDTINNMAEKIKVSDKIKNDFISTVSHELRTPLTAIKGWGETLLQIADTDPTLLQRGMGVIISESSRLNGIVEELLDFSRMQSGRMSLKIEKMDVLAELDESVFAFKDRAMREGKELVYTAPNLPAPMDGDPDRIKQVFVNILDNALKYTKQGGKILTVAEINDDRITITVSDTGCGISEEDLPHVKEKFYKTNMTVHGSGIGLAVVDEIIRMHNGTFDIDSVLDQGTTVTICFDIDHVEIEDAWDIEEAIAKENEKRIMEEIDNV